MTESKADKELEELGHIKVKETPSIVIYNTVHGNKEFVSIEIDKKIKEVSFTENTFTLEELQAVVEKMCENITREEIIEKGLYKVIKTYNIDMEIKDHKVKMKCNRKTNWVDICDIGNSFFLPDRIPEDDDTRYTIEIFDRYDGETIGYYTNIGKRKKNK